MFAFEVCPVQEAPVYLVTVEASRITNPTLGSNPQHLDHNTGMWYMLPRFYDSSGCFSNLGRIRGSSYSKSLLFGVCIRAADAWKLP